MIEENIISSKVIESIKSLYFIHYKDENNIEELLQSQPPVDPLYEERCIKVIWSYLVKNYEELSKNNWELHKKLIKEGVNPNEIAKIIRNDDIQKLQEISSQTNFDYNQIIEPSIYERCDFINQGNVTLIDYAAFFGSINCFKYLLMNDANPENAIKYAVAGGNLEIFHLCEQNCGISVILYEKSIIFHRNDIFYYLYNKYDIKNIKNPLVFMDICITYANFEVLSFLIKEGMRINKSFICKIAYIGNINLIQDFIEGNNFPNCILVPAAKSGNKELVKYLVRQKSININAKFFNYFYS